MKEKEKKEKMRISKLTKNRKWLRLHIPAEFYGLFNTNYVRIQRVKEGLLVKPLR